MQSFNLNLIPSSFQQVFNLSQYDVGRQLTIKLFDGATDYTPPTGATVKVEATKPSGLGFSVSCTCSGSTVTLTTTETMTNEWGRFPAELSITESGDVLGTANFLFNIEKSPHPDGTTDGDAATLVPYLTQLVEDIENSNAKIESLTATATQLSPGATPTASYNSTTNVLTLGIPSTTYADDGNGNITIS